MNGIRTQSIVNLNDEVVATITVLNYDKGTMLVICDHNLLHDFIKKMVSINDMFPSTHYDLPGANPQKITTLMVTRSYNFNNAYHDLGTIMRQWARED